MEGKKVQSASLADWGIKHNIKQSEFSEYTWTFPETNILVELQ